MRAMLLALLLSIGVCAQAGSEVPTSIRMASDVWVDRINPDGTGLSWDILRKVFEPAGVRLEMQIVPYTRSIGLVKRGEADAWVASYQNEVSGGVVYPTWHYDSDLISALSLVSKPEPDQAQLGRSRLVWMRGYEYQRYIPGLTHYNELQRRSGILSMLDQGHADYYIDARPEVEQVLSVDGQRKLVRVGQTGPGGVQVVSVDSRGAVLRVDGVERSYGLSREYNTEGFAAPQKQTLSIARSNGGHYWAEGAINGRAQQFLVDTGATSVALNENHARRLGIDYRTSGQPIQVSTASGTARGWRVTLDKVSVGSLQVLGVEAVVLEGASPSEADGQPLQEDRGEHDDIGQAQQQVALLTEWQ